MSLTDDIEAGIRYINSVADQSAQLLKNINGLMQEQRDQVKEMKNTVIEIKDLVKENMESKEEVLMELKKDIRNDVGRFYTKIVTFSIPIATLLAFIVTIA